MTGTALQVHDKTKQSSSSVYYVLLALALLVSIVVVIVIVHRCRRRTPEQTRIVVDQLEIFEEIYQHNDFVTPRPHADGTNNSIEDNDRSTDQILPSHVYEEIPEQQSSSHANVSYDSVTGRANFESSTEHLCQ